MIRRRLAAAILLPALLSACTTDLTRLERTLAARDSATTALGQWCRAKGIADPPTIRAQRIHGDDEPASATIRELLDVDGNQSVEHRHVRLTCGDAVLSVAHNWYVPSRLTPDMIQTLETTDTPFGKVVAPLNFARQRLSSRRGAGEGCPPGTVLTHRALLTLADGRAISLVVECYTRANLRR